MTRQSTIKPKHLCCNIYTNCTRTSPGPIKKKKKKSSLLRKFVRSCVCKGTYLLWLQTFQTNGKNIRKCEATEIADSTKQRKCSVIFTRDDDIKHTLQKQGSSWNKVY